MAERIGGHASEIRITTTVGVMEVTLVLETYDRSESWVIVITSGIKRVLVITLFSTMAECLGSDSVVEASQAMASGGMIWKINPPSVLCSRR